MTSSTASFNTSLSDVALDGRSPRSPAEHRTNEPSRAPSLPFSPPACVSSSSSRLAGLGLSKGRKGCGPGCLAAGVAATRYTVKVEPARRESAPSCRRIAALGRAWRPAPPPAARQSQAGPTIRNHPSAPLAAPLPGCLAALAAPRHAADCHYTATLPALGRPGPPWAPGRHALQALGQAHQAPS